MDGKNDKLVSQFPEEYQDTIREMLNLRQDTNAMLAEKGKKVRMPLERKVEQLLAEYGEVPTANWQQTQRMRNLLTDRATAERVYNRAAK